MKAPFKINALTLLISIALTYSTAAFSAGTVEDEVPADDWQTFVQMDLDNGYYESAMERLETVKEAQETSSADWNNFMGYTLRKQEEPDLVAAENHYKKALELKADHKGALEYYGELKLLQDDVEGAKALMTTLQ
ncbi:MAG: tetratricopeptide repeat protein, partial [Leucothrix sp.]